MLYLADKGGYFQKLSKDSEILRYIEEAHCLQIIFYGTYNEGKI
jgi:hypothetical protein